MTEPNGSDAAQTADGQGDQQVSAYAPPPTQADLDRIIADRVSRTKNQFKDYGELKAKAAELDQIKQANQTESERLTQELSQLRTEAENWRHTAVKSRIEALAGDFADPADALLVIEPSQFLDASTGQINDAAIKAELAAVLERKPNWRKQPDAPQARLPWPNPVQGGAGQPASSPNDHMNALIRNARSGQ